MSPTSCSEGVLLKNIRLVKMEMEKNSFSHFSECFKGNRALSNKHTEDSLKATSKKHVSMFLITLLFSSSVQLCGSHSSCLRKWSPVRDSERMSSVERRTLPVVFPPEPPNIDFVHLRQHLYVKNTLFLCISACFFSFCPAKEVNPSLIIPVMIGHC